MILSISLSVAFHDYPKTEGNISKGFRVLTLVELKKGEVF